MRVRFIPALLTCLMIPFNSCPAEEWPTKSVRLVVPFDAGGSADLISRRLTDELGRILAQQFYVENRPGGGGSIAAKTVARSAPDGYTFIQSGMSSFIISPVMNDNFGSDPVNDFTHIAYIGGAPSVIVVHPSLNVNSFEALITVARHQEGGLPYASAGLGTVGNIVTEYIAHKETASFSHVPYKAGGAAILDLLAGRVKMGAMNWTTVREYVLSGELIPLAVSSRKRIEAIPNIPSLFELGYEELATTTWQALSAPRGLDAAVITRLQHATYQALKASEIHTQMQREGIETEEMDSRQVTSFVASEAKKWRGIIKSTVMSK